MILVERTARIVWYPVRVRLEPPRGLRSASVKCVRDSPMNRLPGLMLLFRSVRRAEKWGVTTGIRAYFLDYWDDSLTGCELYARCCDERCVSAMMYECMIILLFVPPPPHPRASPQPSWQVCAYDCLVYMFCFCVCGFPAQISIAWQESIWWPDELHRYYYVKDKSYLM